jgi:hypothetical protein
MKGKVIEEEDAKTEDVEIDEKVKNFIDSIKKGCENPEVSKYGRWIDKEEEEGLRSEQESEIVKVPVYLSDSEAIRYILTELQEQKALIGELLKGGKNE